MAVDNTQLTPDEIAQLMRRAGLAVEAEDLENLEKAYAEIEAAGRRVRRNRSRNDEPAGAFRVPSKENRG